MIVNTVKINTKCQNYVYVGQHMDYIGLVWLDPLWCKMVTASDSYGHA